MGIMEIVLILLGVIVFVLSFLLPAGKKNDINDSAKIDEETIKNMVEKEVEGARSQIGDIVDETITYAMEKTERSMERLTNEKIMAVNEYSDTVLEEINKNHKEVVFMYDMLNDKHENLKTTVSEAVKAAAEVKQTVKDVEENFVPISPERVEVIYEPPVEEKTDQVVQEEKPQKPESAKKSTRKPRAAKTANKETVNKEAVRGEVPEVQMALNAAGETSGRNSNERILELHKAGKSNMAIAKELGLGIGEVKLVIDLFEGI